MEVNPKAGRRELDMLLATGEQVTASLLAMAIAAQGLEARSYTGWQAGVTTESVHGNARIEQVHAEKIVSTLESGAVAVITGFQGVDTQGELTTLGRGDPIQVLSQLRLRLMQQFVIFIQMLKGYLRQIQD